MESLSHLHKKWWRGVDSNHRRRSRQIYSLIPLATREPLRANEAAYCPWEDTCCQHRNSFIPLKFHNLHNLFEAGWRNIKRIKKPGEIVLGFLIFRSEIFTIQALNMVPAPRVELGTYWLQVSCSTNWAMPAMCLLMQNPLWHHKQCGAF